MTSSGTAELKGCSWSKPNQRFLVSISVLGKRLHLCSCTPEEVEQGARLYDAVQLLLHGPRANTNFEWSSYSRANITAAVKLLQDKGVDVPRAVVAARTPGQGSAGEWLGVVQRRSSWAAQVRWSPPDNIQKPVLVRWGGLPGMETAIHHADCGFLAIRGLDCIPNLPASNYSQTELEQAGEAAVDSGVDKDVVLQNLAAVQQVCVDGF
jgi:hypothetical protein